MKLFRVVALAGALSIIGLNLSGCAAPIKPVKQELHNVASPDVVEQAIVKAATERGWHVKKESENTLIAKLNVRDHSVTVSIPFSKDGYEINYVTSEGLNAKPDGTIHSKYNTWLNNLKHDIQNNLYF